MNDELLQYKEEVQTLVSSTTAYLKDDKEESQSEIIKVTNEAKKLKIEIDQASKELATLRKTQKTLQQIIETHLKMSEKQI